jgi:hypothetical protein
MAAVVFEGEEVGRVAGFIARALPLLDGDEFELADLMLDKALAGMDGRIAPDLQVALDKLRTPPAARR